MSISANIKQQVQEVVNEGIIGAVPVSGGCIADAQILTTTSGKRYFLKMVQQSNGMFFKEANGLKELAKPDCIKVPQVLGVSNDFLLLTHIDTGSKTSDFFAVFGTQLAQLHRYTSDGFGFMEDNFIGATPQYNLASGSEKNNWAEFYYQNRLLPQLQMAEKQCFTNKELTEGMIKLEGKIDKILEGSEEPPTLLHGDLWGGNYMCDSDGNPVLIDPAVYYGHREADLAMTKMFGGFSPEFYEAYQAEFPLPEGWEFRQNLYLLYHYLNHLNLFGYSYYGTSISLIRSYL